MDQCLEHPWIKVRKPHLSVFFFESLLRFWFFRFVFLLNSFSLLKHKLASIIFSTCGCVCINVMCKLSRNNLETLNLKIILRRHHFPFRTRSLPFVTAVYCQFHEEDKVLIVELQLILTLTLQGPRSNFEIGGHH